MAVTDQAVNSGGSAVRVTRRVGEPYPDAGAVEVRQASPTGERQIDRGYGLVDDLLREFGATPCALAEGRIGTGQRGEVPDGDRSLADAGVVCGTGARG